MNVLQKQIIICVTWNSKLMYIFIYIQFKKIQIILIYNSLTEN